MLIYELQQVLPTLASVRHPPSIHAGKANSVEDASLFERCVCVAHDRLAKVVDAMNDMLGMGVM